jgi:hypothetical protein
MNEDNGKKWEMPEPVFRKSTGELVAPSDGLDVDPEPDTLPPDAPGESEVETGEFDIGALRSSDIPPEPAAVAGIPEGDPLARLYDPPPGASTAPKAPPGPAAAPAVMVEPQPFISEQFTAEKIDVKRDVPAAGSTRPAVVLLGILLVLAAAAAVAGLVYFLFFAGRVPVSPGT